MHTHTTPEVHSTHTNTQHSTRSAHSKHTQHSRTPPPQVTEGSGRVVVTAIGLDSEWGKTLALVVCESPDTPLQEKLSDLAGSIGKVGALVAIVTFIVLLVRWCVYYQGFPWKEFDSGPLKFFLYAVTIVVVAVPEGLPLAVTISLGYRYDFGGGVVVGGWVGQGGAMDTQYTPILGKERGIENVHIQKYTHTHTYTHIYP